MDLNSGRTRKEIAANLRRERRMLGISQERLARRSGVNQSKVSRLERGVQKLDIEMLLRLAAALGKTVDALLPKWTADGPVRPRPSSPLTAAAPSRPSRT